MAKQMRNTKRAQQRLLAKRSELIDEAIELGHVSFKKIKEHTELDVYIIKEVLAQNRELNLKYAKRRKTVVDIAADSMQDIVEDPSHPQHFQAVKFMLQNFKSDFNEVLESHDSEVINVASVGDTSAPVTIVFGSTKKDKEKEE